MDNTSRTNHQIPSQKGRSGDGLTDLPSSLAVAEAIFEAALARARGRLSSSPHHRNEPEERTRAHGQNCYFQRARNAARVVGIGIERGDLREMHIRKYLGVKLSNRRNSFKSNSDK